MKIFDCTTFYNEKMMMDVRFNVLDQYVSKFIVVESTFSHSGNQKELNFNIDDYPKFKIFINTSKKVPQSYKRFYENILRKKFSLIGVPIQLDFISAKNPYIKKN